MKRTIIITSIVVVLCIVGIMLLVACGTNQNVNGTETVEADTTQGAVAMSEETTDALDVDTNEQNEAAAPEETVLAEDSESESAEAPEAEQDEQAVNGYLITFISDPNVAISVYDTQDVTGNKTTGDVYAKDGSTGAILTDGNGQVNFVIDVADGYELGPIAIEGTYKNLKTPEETGTGAYRITKIQSDLTVTVTVNEVGTRYQATFVLGEGVKAIRVSDTQDMTEAAVASTAYARDSESGEILADGNGQINFIVELEDGYALDEIVVEGTYKNLKTPEETGTGAYRITKITSDLTVTVTASN